MLEENSSQLELLHRGLLINDCLSKVEVAVERVRYASGMGQLLTKQGSFAAR